MTIVIDTSPRAIARAIDALPDAAPKSRGFVFDSMSFALAYLMIACAIVRAFA